MTDLYFAYGSNLHPARMTARIPSAEGLGVAALHGLRLVCNKLGRDGTAKANLESAPKARVLGVLWRLPEDGWRALDEVEVGYQRVLVEVEQQGSWRPAQTYRSTLLSADVRLRADYKRWIVEGARAQGLPATWLARLEVLPVLDPPAERRT
ncbi:MAG: gamma-glutamylcyclotransferase family protein [Myxococcota bacterium]